MKTLDMLWQRVTLGAETCVRCGDTGESVRRAAEDLRRELAGQDIAVVLTEKALPPFAVAESNRVFFNGESVEDLLGAQVGMNHCQSCCEMLGEQTDCRTLTLEGREYEALPEELLLRAGRIAAGKMK
ncbi:MAG: DUF2703 domain-containing protein [Humidesulfovibrio sp.]|uniref:DUF2703 domain-containing protein n=1 Tax=Humidesulfovibrio sp. TaxID=2910988 RepID=UPI0027F81CEB|nr:DUF2703 domain-containing protein [Humidesulfovibrio sp.]MDQ7836471.1 DUF2703 domain-containing protein [Humidesulfovibrio sp.]